MPGVMPAMPKPRRLSFFIPNAPNIIPASDEMPVTQRSAMNAALTTGLVQSIATIIISANNPIPLEKREMFPLQLVPALPL
jgi:hypothetical protein